MQFLDKLEHSCKLIYTSVIKNSEKLSKGYLNFICSLSTAFTGRGLKDLLQTRHFHDLLRKHSLINFLALNWEKVIATD